MRSVYGNSEYADVQKKLETELARLRVELKVPEQDPPASALPGERQEAGLMSRSSSVPL